MTMRSQPNYIVKTPTQPQPNYIVKTPTQPQPNTKMTLHHHHPPPPQTQCRQYLSYY